MNCHVDQRNERAGRPATASAAETQHAGDIPAVAGRAHAVGGDEIGRTQQGNNNAYCQDNALRLVQLGPHSLSSRIFHSGAPIASGLPPSPLLSRPAHPRRCGQRSLVV